MCGAYLTFVGAVERSIEARCARIDLIRSQLNLGVIRQTSFYLCHTRKTMSEASESAPQPGLACPTCGAPLSLVAPSQADELGPRHMAFACPAGHRVVVEINETYDDEDLDHAV